MSQARVTTFHTVKSLAFFCKVCRCIDSRSPYSLGSVKDRISLRNFSTLNSAATDDSFNYQNPSQFPPTNERIASGYDKDWSFRRSSSEFGENPNGVYGENSLGVQRNPSRVYEQNRNSSDNLGGRGSFRSEFQRYPDGNNVNFNGYHQIKTLQHGSNQAFEESRSVQSPYRSNNEVSGEFPRGVNVQYVENNGILQQNQTNYNTGEGSGGHIAMHQQHNNWFNQKSIGVDRIYDGNGASNQQGSSGFYNNSSGRYNQIPNSAYNGMVGSQSLSYSQPDEESVGAGEDGQLRGTIDELDAFCKERKLKEAVKVLGLLEQHRISVDIPRYLLLMEECGEAQALNEAKYVHEHLVRSVPHLDVRISNKILEMYSKCGSMDDAYTVFHKMAQRNLTTWDTMITWLAKNGHGEDAIDMFSEFKRVGLKPDSQMFFGVFTACSVVGDMREGLLHFESMNKNYNVAPSTEHYSSVVEMLGSAGYLHEALEFIEKMPMEPGVEVWEIMMNQCRVHGDTELGDRCAEYVETLDPCRLSEESKAGLIPAKASDLAKEKEKKRLSSFNPLEIKTKVYEYRAGDTSHPDHEKLYSLLRCLKQPMKEVGYVPETKFVLHDIDQESKEEALLSHSERLALSQALMTSPARAPVRIIKNLRVCGDCHNALKIISKLVGRLIVARDAKRFHHFENGVCSCGDYW